MYGTSDAYADTKTYKEAEMTYIVSVSGGLGSAEALRRTLDWKGRENTVAIFADVGVVKDDEGRHLSGEDEDLYRFLSDLEGFLDFEITRIVTSEYSDIWDVFFKRRMMGSSLRDPCSAILKRKAIQSWIEENGYTSENSVRVLGFGRAEAGRAVRYEELMNSYNWKTFFPLIEDPYCDNATIREWLEENGIDIPRLYRMGFGHNNCGGFCVKMGVGQAYDLWTKMPWRYQYHEEMEQKFRREISEKATIFRQSNNGKLVPVTMKELREQFEKGYVPRTANLGGKACGGTCMIPGSEMVA